MTETRDKGDRSCEEQLLQHVTPGRGSIKTDPGYKEDRHKTEMAGAYWLHQVIGGDITLLKQIGERPGGMIMDFTNSDLQLQEAIKVVGRMADKRAKNQVLIIIKKQEEYYVIKTKEREVSAPPLK